MSAEATKDIVIGITLGDAAGIGPEVVVKALADRELEKLASFLLIADAGVVEKVQKHLGTSLDFRVVEKPVRDNLLRESLNLLDLGNLTGKEFVPGQVNLVCGQAAVEYIEQAVKLAEQKIINAVVTAPISKEAINLAGCRWPGHTEFLAHLTGTRNFAMMLVGGPLRVVLVTTHLALKEVSSRLSEEAIYRTIKLTHRALSDYFQISAPRIGVCALNPHAGEGGTFGDEEERIIAPAVARAQREPGGVKGPLSADALFYQAYQGGFDAVVVMYHDQGLIPLKMVAFEKGVNLTLGLPFVRTSPDHGTGFDIVGKNVARPDSMREALRLAVELSLKGS